MYERHPATGVAGVNGNAPLAWISVGVCAIATIVLTFYPIAPSNILPLVK